MMVPIIPRFMGRTSSPPFEVPACCGPKHLASRDCSGSAIYGQLTEFRVREGESRDKQDQQPSNQEWNSGV
jgi:hypothetical protein